jgi:hypothetical protein
MVPAGFLLAIVVAITARDQDIPKLSGPYLGQKPPGLTPEVFARGIMSSDHQEHSSLACSPDDREIWWSRLHLPLDMDRYPQVIRFSRSGHGAWGRPQAAPFSGKFRDGDPTFSSGGSKIYFYSRRPYRGESAPSPQNDIWCVEGIGKRWNRPLRLDPAVNSSSEDATPSLAANGGLYFTSDRMRHDDPGGNTDLYECEFRDGDFAAAWAACFPGAHPAGRRGAQKAESTFVSNRRSHYGE